MCSHHNGCCAWVKMSHPTSIYFWQDRNYRGFKTVRLTNNSLDWKVGLRQFEEIHGISLLVNKMSDRIITGLQISKENLPDPNDGSFMIDIQLELCNHYITIINCHYDPLHDENTNLTPDYELHMSIKPPKPTQPHSLLDSMTIITNGITQLGHHLKARDYHNYEMTAIDLFIYADCVRETCEIYLKVAHPLLDESRRPAFQPHNSLGYIKLDHLSYIKLDEVQTDLEKKANCLARELDKIWFQEYEFDLVPARNDELLI